MPFRPPPVGAVAVIFVSQRTVDDADGYSGAAAAMEALAAQQRGFLGFVAARGEDGLGIAVSYWQDDAAAQSWRDHPDHAAVRDRGRSKWYDGYALGVTRIERAYAWNKAEQ